MPDYPALAAATAQLIADLQAFQTALVTAAGPPPPPPPLPPTTISPDGTMIAAGKGGTLQTADGTWSFGTTLGSGGFEILLNGQSAAGGSATLMEVKNGGKLYVENNLNNWYQWTGTGWSQLAGAP